MRSDERLGLARQAYQRAVTLVRAQSTPTTWGRLLTAARNLDSAKRDRARERARWQGDRPSPGTAVVTRPAAPTVSDRALTPPGPEPADAPVVVMSMPAVRVPPRPFGLARWLELAQEWERSRVLRERSRQLTSEAQELCAVVGDLAARWPYEVAQGRADRASRARPAR